MKKFFQFLLYLTALAGFGLIRLLPHGALRFPARLGAWAMIHFMGAMKLCCANIRVALPDEPPERVEEIARQSLFNVSYNLLESIWMNGNPKRIEFCGSVEPSTLAELLELRKSNTRFIFVNPHLGSWEASGVFGPYYGKFEMAAIAKPVHNPYLNKLLNKSGREKVHGLHIIFSRGAMRAATHALKTNVSLGTLIDQNTRVRDGGEFVDFFGLPAPCSKAPATLLRFCAKNGISAKLYFTVCIRENGKLIGFMNALSKPLAEYADDREIIQELLKISESYIRKYPEQYVWFYKRFCYIPQEASEELQKRYPYYARLAPPNFYAKKNQFAGCGQTSSITPPPSKVLPR